MKDRSTATMVALAPARMTGGERRPGTTCEVG